MVSICDLVLYILIQRSLALGDPPRYANEGNYATGESDDSKTYQVGIYGLSLENEICGGAIISSSWIITAAQCIKKSNGGDLTIVAGSTTRGRDHKTILAEMKWAGDGSVRLNVMKTLLGQHAQIMSNANGCVGARIMHPEFANPSEGNDIAVVELSCGGFKFSKYVKPIALPESDLEISTDLLVSGWGLLEERLPRWAHFSVINEISVTKATCEEKKFAQDKIFCATGKKSSENVETCRPLGNVECYGDAGGPAVASVSGEMRLAGITSFGKSYPDFYASQQCEDPASEVKYVNVWNYVQWINETTNGLHERPHCDTKKNGRCIFPFTENNVTYNGCELGWCPFNSINADGGYIGESWDWCKDESCSVGGSNMQVVQHRRQ